MEYDLIGEEMEDDKLDNEREPYWRMMFEENYGGVDDKRSLLNAKRWDVYVNEKENIIKGGYLVEFVGHDRKKVIWEVQYNHVIEEPTDHNEIGQWGLDFNLFNEKEKGVGRERSSEFPYLLMLINLRHGD